jgi:hypothetical protein
MIKGMETEVGIIASTNENNLGNLNINKICNSCSSCCLIASKTSTI